LSISKNFFKKSHFSSVITVTPIFSLKTPVILSFDHRIDSPNFWFVSPCGQTINGGEIKTYEIDRRTTKD